MDPRQYYKVKCHLFCTIVEALSHRFQGSFKKRSASFATAYSLYEAIHISGNDYDERLITYLHRIYTHICVCVYI